VAIFPPGASLNAFDWRVSIADVERSGPFSLFPGIDRQLAMLKGRVALSIAGRATVELFADSPPIAFPGDVVVAASVIGGPATDLNVMTRRSVFRATMTRRKLEGVVASNQTTRTTLVFPLATTTITHGAEQVSLEKGDALLAEQPTTISVSRETECYWIELYPAD
jgi:environmental stress-induced protein Ves